MMMSRSLSISILANSRLRKSSSLTSTSFSMINSDLEIMTGKLIFGHKWRFQQILPSPPDISTRDLIPENEHQVEIDGPNFRLSSVSQG